MTAETTRHTSHGMHTRLVATAADVISRAMQQGRTLPAALAVALDSAQLLQSPDTAAELDRLRHQSATGPSTLASEEHAKVTELIGNAKPAADSLLVGLAESVRDRREHEHPTWEDLYCLNLVSWMGERMGPVLRRLVDAEARVSQLKADLEASDREYEAATTRVAALEARLAKYERPADGGGYPPALPWARLMDADDVEGFLDDLVDAASGDDDLGTLDEVESAIARWRVIGEAQHAHNTAPGPDATKTGGDR